MTRILHVNKFLYRRGGAEAYMLDLAELQRGEGHDVAFFGMQHEDNEPQEFAELFPSQVDFDPSPASISGKLEGFGRMLWSSTARRGISEVLDRFEPDVVHLHNIYHQLSPSILRPASRRRVPLVMTVHDYALVCPTHNLMSHGEICESCIGGSFGHAVRKRCQGGSLLASVAGAAELAVHTRLDAYGPIDTFICPSHFIHGKLSQAGFAPERLRRLPHFAVMEQPAKTTPGTGILFAGRLSYEKGVDVLIRAMALVPGPVGLTILGDGPERASLVELADRLAPGRVRFLGRLSGREVSEWLYRSAVSVVPSRWFENQPLAILEAYTSGTAVVGTDLGGISELVTPSVTGALFENGSESALAARLTELLSDSDACFRMGLAGRAWVEQEFSPRAHLAGLDEIYDRAGARQVA